MKHELQSAGRPHRGPHALFSLAEVQRIAQALAGAQDDEARSIIAKCSAAITSSPKFREPHE